MDELATLLHAVAMYAPHHQDDQAAVLRGLAVAGIMDHQGAEHSSLLVVSCHQSQMPMS
jgi:hypothetical protein